MRKKFLPHTIYFLLSIIIFLLEACQSLYPTQTHSTPHFTKGNQFEGALNASVFKGSANVSYSPVKYLALHVNGHYCKQINKPYYTQFTELAGGFYFPYKNSVLSFNWGYGLGDVNWNRTIFKSSNGYVLTGAKYTLTTTFIQVYGSFKMKEEDSFICPSIKYCWLDPTFTYNEYGGLPYTLNKSLNTTTKCIQFSIASKIKFAKHFYYNFNVGLSATKNNSSPFTAVGITYNL